MKKHLPVLDGIRGMAVLMVMWFHYPKSSSPFLESLFHRPLPNFSVIGQTGVDLFFVLSGFLITRILLNSKTEEKYFSVFYARRLLRIFPLYYFYLVLSLFILPIIAGEKTPDFSQYWYWLAHLQNLPMTFGWDSVGPEFYWSLAVEEHFYLLWPLLVYCLPLRKIAIVSMAMIIASFAIRLWMLTFDMSTFYFTLTRLDSLSFGALLAVLEPRLLVPTALNKRVFLWLLSITGVPLLLAFTVLSGSGAMWLQAIKFPLTGLVYFALLGFAVTSNEESAFKKIFESRGLRFLGGISYGLYVYHGLCFSWFEQVVPNRYLTLLMPIAFLLSVVVAYVSFRVLESPFLKLKRFFRHGAIERTVSASS
ncbi:MAG: acyltransferase [Phormidesmis sp.]